MSEKSSLAKRLIKDLVLPKSNNEYDENSNSKSSIKTEPVADGYVIVSFSNRKKAKIQTATFSDVSKSSTEALNILRHQNGVHHLDDVGIGGGCGDDESNIPDEDNFYGEAFWIGSEDEEDSVVVDSASGGGGGQKMIGSQQQHQQSGIDGVSDKSSQKDDSDSLASSQTQRPAKMSRLTALSRGLLPTCLDDMHSTNRLRNSAYYGSSCGVGGGGALGGLSSLNNGNHNNGMNNTEDGRKMLRCRECGKHYRNDYSLRHHICLRRKEVWKKGDVPKQLVDGQLIYFCPSCSKPFRWMGNLTRHFYVHTGQRFFRCGLCDKEFFSAYQVRRHMNSHTGQRYKCRVCDKPFTCVYACTWHMRQHSAAVSPDSILSSTNTNCPTLLGSSHNVPLLPTLGPSSSSNTTIPTVSSATNSSSAFTTVSSSITTVANNSCSIKSIKPEATSISTTTSTTTSSTSISL